MRRRPDGKPGGEVWSTPKRLRAEASASQLAAVGIIVERIYDTLDDRLQGEYVGLAESVTPNATYDQWTIKPVPE